MDIVELLNKAVEELKEKGKIIDGFVDEKSDFNDISLFFERIKEYSNLLSNNLRNELYSSYIDYVNKVQGKVKTVYSDDGDLFTEKMGINTDDFISIRKKYKLEQDNKYANKRVKGRVLAFALAVAIGVGGVSFIANHNNKDYEPESTPTTSSSEFYTDANVKMETIEYLIESGSNISNTADIAAELGISPEQCIQAGNIKVSKEAIIFPVSVPEDIAKKYNAEQEEKNKLKVEKHFVCEYRTPDEFDSLVDVAQEIVNDKNFSGFKEGKEYTKDGRNPANQLAKNMIRDNPDMGSDLQHAKPGIYKLYFTGTTEEYEYFVEEEMLPKSETKSISQN